MQFLLNASKGTQTLHRDTGILIMHPTQPPQTDVLCSLITLLTLTVLKITELQAEMAAIVTQGVTEKEVLNNEIAGEVKFCSIHFNKL